MISPCSVRRPVPTMELTISRHRTRPRRLPVRFALDSRIRSLPPVLSILQPTSIREDRWPLRQATVSAYAFELILQPIHRPATSPNSPLARLFLTRVPHH